MPSIDAKRSTAMSPGAVNEAQLFHGPVHYHSGLRDVDIPQAVLVEVGKPTSHGEEKSAGDYECAYYAALLLGYRNSIHWLSAGPEENRDRKLLISNGVDGDGVPISFSVTEAQIVIAKINEVLNAARNAKGVSAQ